MVTGNVLPVDADRTPKNGSEMPENVPYKDAGAKS